MTKADKARFLAFQTVGCVACRKRWIKSQADVHHLLAGGKRRGHQYTIPLCPWHHRGYTPDGMGFDDAEDYYGPSLALKPRKFREAFGTDECLLRQTDLLVGMIESGEAA